MLGAVRRQWSSIAKPCNAADADPGLNPEGRLPAGAWPCCGSLIWHNQISLPAPCPASRRQPARGMISTGIGSTMSDTPEYKSWMCLICGYIYHEETGAPDDGIPPGTRWEDVPINWTCPDCGARKDDFEMVAF